MARPPELEKRRDLARAAVEVLQREGSDVSMAFLADALGVKRPTLLYHFATKAHILEAALVDLLSEQATFVLERVGQHAHPIDRIFAQLQAVHAFHHGREGHVVFLTQAIASSAGTRVAELIDIGNRVFEAHRQAAVELLRAGIAEGTVAPCDPEALVATTRALTDGLMVQRVMTGVDLAPVHRLIWERLLAPLKIEAKAPALAPRAPAPAPKKRGKPEPTIAPKRTKARPAR